jgi:ribosomal protein S18 acetylase RimI-like enzyme
MEVLEQPTVPIRKFKLNDLDELVELAALAFQPTDLYSYVAEGEQLRHKFLMAIFRYRLTLGVAYEQTDLVEEDGRLIGAAVWTPPVTYNESHQAAKKVLDEIGPMSEAVSSFPGLLQNRWLSFFELFLSARDKVIQQPYWSLTPIAVIPDRQRQKVASSLLRKKFTEIDDQGLPCFLGTQDDLGRDIYLHYGFSISRKDVVGDSRIISYSMIRPPNPALARSRI